jgi:hypothetical protein
MLVRALLPMAAVLTVPWAAVAHLLVSEPERLRNDNHFTTDGFAEPQIGACEPSELDPTGFYCPFRVEDDWSFENLLNIIDETRVPPPGLPGVPGFDVSCSPGAGLPDGTNPGCPLPPAFPGGPSPALATFRPARPGPGRDSR